MAPDNSPPLDDVLDCSTIAALKAPSLAETRGLPASVYTSEGVFAFEQRRLFLRTRTGVAFTADVPAPGDAVPVSVASVPTVVMRDDPGMRLRGDGVPNQEGNRCRHRQELHDCGLRGIDAPEFVYSHIGPRGHNRPSVRKISISRHKWHGRF